MSVTVWAQSLICDYPECKSVADVRSQDEVPAGWLRVRHVNMMVTDAYGRQLTDMCSLHAKMPLDMLAEALTKAGR